MELFPLRGGTPSVLLEGGCAARSKKTTWRCPSEALSLNPRQRGSIIIIAIMKIIIAILKIIMVIMIIIKH